MYRYLNNMDYKESPSRPSTRLEQARVGLRVGPRVGPRVSPRVGIFLYILAYPSISRHILTFSGTS